MSGPPTGHPGRILARSIKSGGFSHRASDLLKNRLVDIRVERLKVSRHGSIEFAQEPKLQRRIFVVSNDFNARVRYKLLIA
jgi:hypothetical protein